MTIFQNINRLISYSLLTGLIKKEDIIFTQNKLLDLFNLNGFETYKQSENIPSVTVNDLEYILNEMLQYADEHKLADLSTTADKDMFDTRIMGLVVPPPSNIIEKFQTLYKDNSKTATDWYYNFSRNTNYIRSYRVKKDMKWKVDTEYGKLDITINLSKPEKDPKKIAAAGKAKQAGYPLCLLCRQNEGYNGSSNRVARQNHRIIPITLANEKWGMQYSPYVYFNEHCIVFNYDHRPMKIWKKTFQYLLDFVSQFPHYILGSNADLPIVGGSILTHDHFQGGSYNFPLAQSPLKTEFTIPGFENVKCGIVKWPMSVIRIISKDSEELVNLANKILTRWRSYTDKDAGIFSETENISHNTITPIARKRNNNYELDLVLRNNITTKEHPLGVFHPHAKLHHIKKENIGLIEVMGLAILPARLKSELEEVANCILTKQNPHENELISKHADWINSFLPKYNDITKENISDILNKEVGIVFMNVLKDAGVYKDCAKGEVDFMRFIKSL